VHVVAGVANATGSARFLKVFDVCSICWYLLFLLQIYQVSTINRRASYQYRKVICRVSLERVW